MTDVEQAEIYQYYEPQYFALSPVYKSWVKLFISDCHRLRSLDGFEGTKARFWKNHPIRWIQIVGIIIGINIRSSFAEIELDDGSGSTINVSIRDKVAESIELDPEHNFCSVDVGQLLRVKGTLVVDYKSELQLIADKIDVLRDPSLEWKAWQERIVLRKTVLDIPWLCDSNALKPNDSTITSTVRTKDVTRTHDSKQSKNVKALAHARKKESFISEAGLDVSLLDVAQHTLRNLKLVFLHYFARHGIRTFSVAQLRLAKEVEQAVSCVTAKRTKTYVDIAGLDSRPLADSLKISSSQKYRTINACLAELVRDGSVICLDVDLGTYSVVGVWNLGVRLQEIMQDMFASDTAKVEVTVREMWQAVRISGGGFESVSKQMVQKVLGEMQNELNH